MGSALLPAGAPVAAVLAWRYLITAVLLVPVALPVLRRSGLAPRDLAQQAVLGILGHAVFLGGVFGGTAAGVDPGTSAIVCAMQPLVILVVLRVRHGERIGGRRTAGIVLGTAAVLLAVGGVAASGGVAVLLPLASLLGLSGSALLERRWRPRTEPLAALSLQVLAATLVLLPVAAVTGGLDLIPGPGLLPGPPLLAALAWLVLLSGIGGYLGFLQCLRRIGASATSSLLYLTPAVTALWSWLMLGTSPAPAQLAALVLSGLAVGLLLRRPAPGEGSTLRRATRGLDGPAPGEGSRTAHADPSPRRPAVTPAARRPRRSAGTTPRCGP